METMGHKKMFQPKIVKVCPVEDGKGIYIEWTVPKRRRSPPVIGYTVAYRRCDLDIDFSTRGALGGATSSIVVSPSRASSVYEIKVAAFSHKEQGEYCPPISWSLKDKEEITSPLAKLIPIPRVNKLATTDKGRGVLIQWEVPNDVTSVIIEGFLIAYRQCGLGSTNQVKLVPGSDISIHVLTGLQTCTLYELKVAAYIGEGKGRYSIPMIIRTGVQTPETMLIQKSTEPRYIPKIVRMYPVTDPAGIYVKWTPPTQYFGPTIAGYVLAFREAKSPDKSFQTCYIRGINSSFHVIKGVRKGVDYEVKLAAYNPSGDGPFSLKRLVRNSGERISSTQVKQILKKNKIKLPT
ncbi:protein sidekick-1-like isoform X1 [Mizuhopecten yessoensis]|uniref:Protein sidekick-1 n=2 Tax=Mizuhopecten yessoensis TaxID=6573 RepID=A0A210PY90_MIZYE|nr:protein sidekick-1-like isoform X1 [Mizuhopecten yessoensis]XP_021372005.1 protein sidekick-1-like isoform X1 [Mizuhopecten yessoensis]XP_021372006.1 protein sidekick-1-like isoform X1 [Mizuhopecten yessoensis]XP_021372007.1 protein sidekick-1-like isoform X1 [Mizuhopecten yessoensis]OWF41443.1 Protein sidekick-1 [Mizuhopecten yessoensis]